MNEAITLKGIDQAIEGLNYRNKNALKYKLIYAIREFYYDDSSVETLEEIDPKKLIGLLWNTENNPAAVNNKRKNLNSLKSSINADLKKIYEEDKNPEGIVIGANYIFSMSEEAKDNTLKTFANKVMIEGEVNLDDVAKALSAIDKILSDSGTDSVKDKLNQLDKLKETIRVMSEKYGGFGSSPESKDAGGDEKGNSGISDDDSDPTGTGHKSGDKGGSESEESGKEDISGISTKSSSDQTGSESEGRTEEGSGDKSGNITDSKTDGEDGSGADASG
ncbi:MAG: hypothetical protein KKC46_03050, partial [Proteobacteria bacterium]|nr:hypothetical protein [Pseudomonadota bacterium]